MYLLSHYIHSVLMGTLILHNTKFSPTPRLTYQPDAGEIPPLLSAIMGAIASYTEAYKNFQRQIDETPPENPRLHNMTYAFYGDIQKKLSELSDFASGSSIQPTLWPTLYSFASDLPKLNQNLDDLIEISGSDYGQHLFEIQKSLEKMGIKVWNVLGKVADFSYDANMANLIRRFAVGASVTDLYNQPGLSHWDGGQLVETVVVLGYQKAGFQKTLSFVLSLSDVSGKVVGLKTLHIILTATGQIYDQDLFLVVGVHLWRLRSSPEGGSAFAMMPTVIQTLLSPIRSQESKNFNFCIRGNIYYCCLQIAPIYPIWAGSDKEMTCLGKSEIDHFKTLSNPINLYTYDGSGGVEINANQDGVKISLYFQECLGCNCGRNSYGDMSGVDFFCPKNGVYSLPSSKWKVVLQRGNGYQLQCLDNNDKSVIGKWAGICQQTSPHYSSQQPYRLPCFVDQPQTLYTASYPNIK